MSISTNYLVRAFLFALLLPTAAVSYAQAAIATNPAPVAAASSPNRVSDPNFSIGVQVSTLGLGAQIGKQITPNFGIRLGVSSYSYGHDFNSDGISYSGSLKLSSESVLADLYPSKASGFHLTAGLIENSNTLNAHSTPNQPITINGHTYSLDEVGTIDTNASFPKPDAYLGLGFGNPSGAGSRARLYMDIGAMFEGSADVSASHHGGTIPAPASLDSDVKSSVQSNLNEIKVYPVASVGVAFHI